MNILEELSQMLQNGDTAAVANLTQTALQNAISPQDILNQGLIAGMTVVGRKFKDHEIFLPDVLMAAKAMYAGMDIIKPLLLKEEIPTMGKVVIGTVQGDLHDIGKNLVGILLKGAGFEVVDLGHDVSPERFIDISIKENAKIIGMSALLTTTMPMMRQVIELARSQGLYGKVRFVIGGAPVTSDYAREIGADAYCFDGVKAVECVKELMAAQ